MDPVKRKVISELFFAPSVVLPIVGGISAALLSWAAGGVDVLNLAGLAGVLGGIGWMCTRVIFKVETITEEALKLQLQQRIDAENAQLDQLMCQLRDDGDARTQDYLTLLRSLRDDFWEFSSRPGVHQRATMLREKVGDVFDATVAQLRDSLRLARLAENLTGVARQQVIKQREDALREISQTIDHLRTTLDQFREMAPDQPRINLSSMREELEASIRVAKRTEQRMREMENLEPSLQQTSQREPPQQ